MSYKNISNCLKFSPLCFLLLLFQFTKAQQSFSKIDAWLEENTEAMGGRSVLLIYKDGKIIYNKAVNDRSQRQKMVSQLMARRKGADNATGDFSSTSKQMIASCSKWLSAALVMTFVDEGKLSLEDTIGQYLPALSAVGKGRIKIWQCLSHLTGIKEPPLRESLTGLKDVHSMDEAVAAIAALPMEGEPGRVFHYSNAGLQLAGAVIEQIGGKSFQALFAERLAGPLGMAQTDFGKGPVALPAGGGWSTPEDYMKFLVMVMNGGKYNGRQILSVKSIEAMQADRIGKDVRIAYSPAEAEGWGYGFGEWVIDGATPGKRTRAVSSPGLFGTFPWVDNERHYSAILFTFYLKSGGRHQRYKELKGLVDEAAGK